MTITVKGERYFCTIRGITLTPGNNREFIELYTRRGVNKAMGEDVIITSIIVDIVNHDFFQMNHIL